MIKFGYLIRQEVFVIIAALTERRFCTGTGTFDPPVVPQPATVACWFSNSCPICLRFGNLKVLIVGDNVAGRLSSNRAGSVYSSEDGSVIIQFNLPISLAVVSEL